MTYVIQKQINILYDVAVLRIRGQVVNQSGVVVPSGRIFYHYDSGPLCVLLADSHGEFDLVIKEGEDITIVIPDMGFDKKIIGSAMPLNSTYVDLFDLIDTDTPSRFNFPTILFHG